MAAGTTRSDECCQYAICHRICHLDPQLLSCDCKANSSAGVIASRSAASSKNRPERRAAPSKASCKDSPPASRLRRAANRSGQRSAIEACLLASLTDSEARGTAATSKPRATDTTSVPVMPSVRSAAAQPRPMARAVAPGLILGRRRRGARGSTPPTRTHIAEAAARMARPLMAATPFRPWCNRHRRADGLPSTAATRPTERACAL